ncbi:DUF3231 family protein [Lederbergia graminis]
MKEVKKAQITAAEIAALWTQYMNETANLYIHRHMLEHIEDNEIKNIIVFAVNLGEKQINKIKSFFKREGHPIPVGFTDDDYTPQCPRMFSDDYCLNYINIMSLHGCHGYSAAVTTCTRQDIRSYFTDCLEQATALCNRTKDLLLKKGLYHRPPSITPAKQVEFVKDNDFLTGWLGEKRSLSCMEISDIYFNLKKSIFAKAFILAAQQVVGEGSAKRLLQQALKIKEKHIRTFSDVMMKEHLPSPPIWDAEITDSTTSPFSEKLWMFQVGFLLSTAQFYYSTGLGSSPRRDLIAKYTITITEVSKVSGDWIKIMIQNHWMEQPPLAENRKQLADK